MTGHYDREEYNKLIEKYNYKDMLHSAFKNVITPKFKELGYKKKGKTFYREREGLIEICEVQYSRGNHRTTASFTYNISIAAPYIFEKLGIEKNKFDTIICGLRFGDVVQWIYKMPDFIDDWYRLEAYSVEGLAKTYFYYKKMGWDEADIEKQRDFNLNWENRYNVKTGERFHEALVEDIENVILPFFHSIPDAESLIKQLELDQPKGDIDERMMFNVGHLYYDNSEEEKGREMLKKIRNGFFKERIENEIQSGRIVL